MKVTKYTSASPTATRALGRRLGRRLKRGDIVLLVGELGTGKTVLVKGICSGLEVAGRVKSPSFVIVNEYGGRLPVFHIDLYRLKPADIAGLNLDEYFYDRGVSLVEWAERLPRVPAGAAMKIVLRHIDARQRSIEIHDLRH